jgi:hypothetical protein
MIGKKGQKQIFSFIILWFCFSFSEITAQSGFPNDLYITANYHKGYILPEYKYSLFIVENYVHSMDLNITKITTGKNDWEQLYHYPVYGFSLFYSTLGNDAVNGKEIAVFPFFNLSIFSRNRFCIDNQIGIGIGYVTRKFDMEDNYRNIAVGSNFNMHFNYRLGLKYQLLDKMQLQTGISFDHFSNGNMQEPNLGLNYLTSFIGVGYRIGNSSPKQVRVFSPHQKDHWFELIYSIGGKHARAFQSKFYFTSSGTVEFKWEPVRVFRVGIGADMFYDSSTETEMAALNLTDHKNYYDFRTGIHLSQEIVYNKISLIIQEGIYLILTDRVNQNIMYNRGIVRYRVTDHILLSIAMKSHLHILDYPEFGLGYRF